MEDHILDFWNKQAEKYGTSHSASWGDNFAISLEIGLIGSYVKEGQTVLDVGCANGFSALHHLKKNITSITGVDFSDKMIEEAEENRKKCSTPDTVTFKVGDVRNLELADNSFDLVYTTRVLINLPTWEEQKQGIAECIRVCRPGGTVIFSEGFWEPLVLLNAMRSLVSLPPLAEHDFNRYLKKSKLDAFLTEQGLVFENIDFSSVYYLGSRFLRELVTDPDDYPGYTNPVNELFYGIEKEYSGGGFGIQQAYVVTK